jgi:hypothetical protein
MFPMLLAAAMAGWLQSCSRWQDHSTAQLMITINAASSVLLQPIMMTSDVTDPRGHERHYEFPHLPPWGITQDYLRNMNSSS